MKTQKEINIFIIDDDRMFAKAIENDIQDVFKGNGIKITKFETGETCLEKIKDEVPNIVILDYHLNSNVPNAMNGHEVLKKINQLYPETVVLMLTSVEQIDVAIGTHQSGAVDYIIKTDTAFEKLNQSLQNFIRIINLEEEIKGNKFAIRKDSWDRILNWWHQSPGNGL